MSTNNDVVYLLLPGMEPDQGDPVAAFSNKQTIDILVEKLSTFEIGASVKMVLSKDNALPVDKFTQLVEAGLLPFHVVLDRDGHLFNKSNILGAVLEEQTLGQDIDYILQMCKAEIKDPPKGWGWVARFGPQT